MMTCMPPRDILLTVGNEIMASANSFRCRYFEYLAYWPLMKQYFDEDPDFLWTQAPRPRLTDASYKHNYYDEKITLEDRLVRTANKDFVTTEVEPMWDAADVMRLMDAVRPGTFAPEALELFAEAERRYGVLAYLRGGVEGPNPSRIVADPTGTGTATSYLGMLVHIIDFRSRHTVTHTVTTAWVAYELALRLLGDKGAAAHVYASALVHDVGKIGIPLSILEKPGRLDADEMAVMRTHVALTEGILEGCVDPHMQRAAVRHHEKLDGSGYPRGLQADELTMPDRIIAVADIVSALVGTRSYKEAYPKEKVLMLLDEQQAAGRSTLRRLRRCGAITTPSVADGGGRRAVRSADAYERVQQDYAWLLNELEHARAVEGSKA